MKETNIKAPGSPVSAANLTSIDELCTKFDKSLKVEVPVDEYNRAIDDIFSITESKIKHDDMDNMEQVLERAYQDHSETRKHLALQVKKNLSVSLDLFKGLHISSIHVFIGCFEDANDTLPLWTIIRDRIHNGIDHDVQTLLSCVIQLLNKFRYNFTDIKFLIRDLGVKINDDSMHSLIIVIYTLLSSQYNGEFDTQFLEFLDALLIEAENDIGKNPLTHIIVVLKAFYPTFTTLCSSVLLGKTLSKMLTEEVSKGSDETFIYHLLTLLSVACIDENVRVHIAENYLPLLENSLKNEKVKLYSSLVLTKTWAFTKLNNVSIGDLTQTFLTNFFENSMESNDKLDMAIEGLAYLSLKTSVKKTLRKDTKFMTVVIEIIHGSFKPENTYGILIILANLSTLPNDSNDSNQSIKDLRDYSDLKTPQLAGKDDEKMKDDPAEVMEFNKTQLIDTQLLSWFNAKFTDLSKSSVQQIVRIIYNLTRTRADIAECVKQGSATSILLYLSSKKANDNTPSITKGNEEVETVRILALRALTKILIYTNPTLIFNKYSPLNAIPCMFELLPIVDPTDLGESSNMFLKSSEHLLPTDQIEALLSLTNIASASGQDGEEFCRTLVSTPKYWSSIENLILDENYMIQRCTLELLSNMMNHPVTLASKIFNFENAQSLRNFNILVKLLLLDDVKSQQAVVAIFANIANTIPFIAEQLMCQDELVKNCIEIFVDQLDDVELRHRLIMLFYALFEVAPQVGPKAADAFERLKKTPDCKRIADAIRVTMSKSDTGTEFKEVLPALLEKLESTE